MKRRFSGGLLMAMLALVSAGCSRSDEEKARERAAEARRKAREEAHELAHEAKRAANAVNRQINQAVNGSGSGSTASGEAGQKLRRGGQDLRAAGSEATVKLDRAAVIAKIKVRKTKVKAILLRVIWGRTLFAMEILLSFLLTRVSHRASANLRNTRTSDVQRSDQQRQNFKTEETSPPSYP